MINLTISRKERYGKDKQDYFIVDDYTQTGSPPVGRGETINEAIGAWLSYNRDRLGVDFVVDKSAQKAVNRRLKEELKKR